MQGLTRDYQSLQPGDEALIWILNFRQYPQYCRNPELNSPISAMFPSALIGCWKGKLVEHGPRADTHWYQVRAVLTDKLVAGHPDEDVAHFHAQEPWTRYLVYNPRLPHNLLARLRNRITYFAVKDLLL